MPITTLSHAKPPLRRTGWVSGMLALLPLVVFSGFALFEAFGVYKAAHEATMRNTARALTAAVDAQLGAAVAAMQSLATSPLLDDLSTAQAFEAQARQVATLLGGVVVLGGPEPGHEILAHSSHQPGQSRATLVSPETRAALTPALEDFARTRQPTVSDLFIGPLVQQEMLAVLVAVQRPGLHTRVLTFSFAPALLRHLLDQQGLPAGTFASIADGKGRIVATTHDPEGRLVGQPMPEWVAGAMAGRRQILTMGRGLQGNAVTYAIERSSLAPGWTVAFSERVTAQRATAWRALRWLLLGGGALGLGLAALFWVHRRTAQLRAAEDLAAQQRHLAEIERLHAGLPAIIFLREFAPDGSSRPLYRSGDLAAVTGWTRAQLGGRMMVEMAEPGTPGKATDAALLRDGAARLDWRMRRPDGSWNWIRTDMRVLERRADGSVLAVGYSINVTAELAAEKRVQAARDELDQTLSRAPVAVFRGRISAEGRFMRTYLSRGIEPLTGWRWEEINPPGGLDAILDPDIFANQKQRIARLLREGSSGEEYRLRRPDGSWIWVRTTASVIARHADGSAEIVGYFTDISDRRAAEAQAIAASRLASLGEMAAGLAHELKQPLQVIALSAETAEIFAQRLAAPEIERSLAVISEQAFRAGAVIDHLRRFARGSEDGAAPERVGLAQVVAGSMVLAGHALKDAAIAVEMDLGEPPPTVLGHAIALEQVLGNLLINARDALARLPPEQPRRVRLAAAASADGRRVQLTVADNGGGIAPAVMARLFEPFVTTKAADQGTGLGLSICHGLIRAMGGSIKAHNSAEGAVFTISLPAG